MASVPADVLSVHESAHAVATVCVGWCRYLEGVSLKDEGGREAACHFTAEKPQDADRDFVTRIAGPLGEIEHAPDAIPANLLPRFREHAHQDWQTMKEANVTGWLGTESGGPYDGDLYLHEIRSQLRERRGPTYDVFLETGIPIDDAEAQVRQFVRRPRVAAAILAVAAELKQAGFVPGERVRQIATQHVTAEDEATLNSLFRPQRSAPDATEHRL